MYQLSEADLIWNRACGEDPLRSLPGDCALADLLRAHGLTMNGGVLHAVEILTPVELASAVAGYRFYNLDAVASILNRAQTLLQVGRDLGLHEQELDRRYAELVPSDSLLQDRFKAHLAARLSDFAPLRSTDTPSGDDERV